MKQEKDTTEFNIHQNTGTPAPISLVWLLAQKPFIVPIPGTRSIDHLNEILGGINIELTSADLNEIEPGMAKNPGR
jgi:aryl-alcohol dehydrogenase-like predicted oxidoreductase